MATANNNIRQSWSLLAFGLTHGELSTQLCKKGTPDEYTCCVFTDPYGKDTYVNFSSNLGELSEEEIAARWNELQVCELEPDAETAARRAELGRQAESYVLCKKGEGTRKKVALDFAALAGLR